MWIRDTDKNANKQGENIKQWTYGENVMTFTRKQLLNQITFLWNKVSKSTSFYKDNVNSYELVLLNDPKMRFKEDKRDFIKSLFIHLTKKKVDGKIWYKEL